MNLVFIELTRLCYDDKGLRQPGKKFVVNTRYLMSFKAGAVSASGHRHEGTTVEYRGNQGYGNHTVLVEETYMQIRTLLDKAQNGH
jgi:hypothetical protein